MYKTVQGNSTDPPPTLTSDPPFAIMSDFHLQGPSTYPTQARLTHQTLSSLPSRSLASFRCRASALAPVSSASSASRARLCVCRLVVSRLFPLGVNCSSLRSREPPRGIACTEGPSSQLTRFIRLNIFLVS